MIDPNTLVMGFDFGTKRIGVAVGQAVTGSASAIAILAARDGIPDWAEVAQLINEWQPGLVVVGLPLNMDASDSPMSVRAEKFARRLTGRFNIPHQTFDERLTSREAREMTGSDRQLDGVAAQLILESFLRSQTSA